MFRTSGVVSIDIDCADIHVGPRVSRLTDHPRGAITGRGVRPRC